MPGMNFSVDCSSCGKQFSRTVQRALTVVEPLTLYCRHCGCAYLVDQSDGTADEIRSVPRELMPVTAASTPVKG